MRSDGVNIALLVHVLGAMVLVGALVTAATAGIVGWNDESARLRQFSYRTLLWVGLPSYIVMRVGAEWVFSKEFPSDYDPSWIGIGYITADGGGLLLLIALILGGIGLRKSRAGGGGDGMLKAGGAISAFLVAVYVVTIWAMGGKPS